MPIIDAEIIEPLAAQEAIGGPTTPAQTVQVVESSHNAVVPNDKLVRVFIKIRDAKSAMKKKADAELAVLDKQLQTISAELKARCIANASTGFKTEAGTVYIAETMKATCGDWDVFYKWIKENNALDMLQQRVAEGEIKNYMKAHDGELPPGISVFRETEARIRKPKEKSSEAEQDEAGQS